MLKNLTKNVVKNYSKRGYVVVASRKAPVDTSRKEFPIEDEAAAQYARSDYELGLLNILSCLRSKEFDTVPKEMEEVKDLAQYNVFFQKNLDPTKKNFVQHTVSEEELTATFGNEWKEKLNDFFSGRLDISNIATEQYLKMNPEKYKEVVEQRATNFLNYAMEVKKNSK
eukprot:gene1512-12638_t